VWLGLKYYGPAHTDGDISVTFAEANIVHVADTYWNGIYPFIDYSTGGSIDGMIAASDANLAATTDETLIIPGHGNPISNKAELKEFRDMLVSIRENVARLKQTVRKLSLTGFPFRLLRTRIAHGAHFRIRTLSTSVAAGSGGRLRRRGQSRAVHRRFRRWA
jgi:glyoxylase-like metal-dependent hydrolase (beta-lactamase superfamily II)